MVQFVVDHLARRGKAGLTWELPPALDAQLVAAGLKQKPGPFKLATVVHRVAVLSAAHQAHKAANPCESPAVRQLLKRGRRASVKRGERPHKKTAITRTELDALLATCDESLEGLRDAALLLFGFASGGRRRSEIAAADWQDLRRIGEAAFVYRLEHSKTQQAGPNAAATPDKPVLGRAGAALEAWLTAANIVEGPPLPPSLARPGRPGTVSQGGGHHRATPGETGRTGGGFWRTQPALGLHHRGRAAGHCPVGPDGPDRASLGGPGDRLLPSRGCQ
ncbi:hypothetical protein [Stenotrophomonas sp. HITSZ_GD]|uniref:hypothetical protein n=1 Tax=Stenotrophomonas sp. HITSZ_GD TaxID=3037248 RepID=UPI0031F2D8BA